MCSWHGLYPEAGSLMTLRTSCAKLPADTLRCTDELTAQSQVEHGHTGMKPFSWALFNEPGQFKLTSRIKYFAYMSVGFLKFRTY